MAFEELFKEYPNKNPELRAAAKVCYEFGMNIAKEPSAGMSIGLDEHAIKRQRTYVRAAQGYLDALHNRPIPDMPYVHPTRFDIDLSEIYTQFTKDGLPLNEDTELLAQYWMIMAVELAGSQSAGLAGSMIDPDFERCNNHLAVITQFVDEMEARDMPDVPETAFPGAILEVPGKKTSK
jgi:hypothetical protein